MSKTQTHLDELTKLQSLLSLNSNRFEEEAKLPCFVLPTVRIARFYDRDATIELIDQHFESGAGTTTEARSIALYGLGGVGKSQTALKYAYKKKGLLDVILWIRSQTSAAVAQSFTDAAIALKLPEVKPNQHTENRIIMLNWLQKTCKLLQTCV